MKVVIRHPKILFKIANCIHHRMEQDTAFCAVNKPRECGYGENSIIYVKILSKDFYYPANGW